MVQSRVEDLSPVVKKVSVELAPDRVKDALDTAYTSVSRTVKLKGYRQGHVPRRLVERYFGDDVKKDVAQKLVSGSIGEALAEHKLDGGGVLEGLSRLDRAGFDPSRRPP